MLNIIYPYRNREIKAIKNSLISLQNQSVQDFQVFFVDYGSKPELSKDISQLVKSYDFAIYSYHPTQFQPWNKSRALNSVIKKLKEGFCFVADVDMIFHPLFVEKAIALQEANTAVYFKVGYLSREETTKSKEFDDYEIEKISKEDATGLTMFPMEQLQQLHGFDEFYHFWGAEDTDMHVRFKNNGGKIDFYANELLLLHQWHTSYMRNEVETLSEDLQLSGIIKLNHEHLKYAKENKVTEVNQLQWGNPISPADFEPLLDFSGTPKIISNKREAIQHLLFVELPQLQDKTGFFIIENDVFRNSKKYQLKKLLGKKLPSYYSLKEINDLLLLHIISFYRNHAYSYRVHPKENRLELKIKKPK